MQVYIYIYIEITLFWKRNKWKEKTREKTKLIPDDNFAGVNIITAQYWYGLFFLLVLTLCLQRLVRFIANYIFHLKSLRNTYGVCQLNVILLATPVRRGYRCYGYRQHVCWFYNIMYIYINIRSTRFSIRRKNIIKCVT